MQHKHIPLIALVATAVSSSPLSPDSSLSTLHSSIEPLSSSRDSHGSLHQCHFTSPDAQSISPSSLSFTDQNRPQVPLRLASSPSTKSSSGIPPSAWPHISTLLTNFIMEQQNSIRTLDLGRVLNDAELEGVMMGLVYSSTSHSNPERLSSSEGTRVKIKRREKRSYVVHVPEERVEAKEKSVDRGVLACVENAVREVERNRQMEGTLEIFLGGGKGDRGGRVNFLVYRVD